MLVWDDFQSDCQAIANDTSATSLALLKRWGNYGYHYILAELGRPFTEKTITDSTEEDVQYYTLPPDAQFVKAVKVTNNSIKYPLEEIPDQDTWDVLNADVTGTSDIPTFFFVRQGFGVGKTEIGLFPIPASDGSSNITIIYESGDKDLATDEYTDGTIGVTNGDATVTGGSTTFTAAMVNRYFKATTDGVWYRIETFTSTTSIELDTEFKGTTASGADYTIAEAFHLPEDMQILPVYYAMAHYYDMKKDENSSLKYRALFESGLSAGKRRWATKTRTAVINKRPAFRLRDPNFPPGTIT